MEAKDQGSRWQYQRLDVPQSGQVEAQRRFDNDLDLLGGEGWEIAAASETVVYLKRKRPTPN